MILSRLLEVKSKSRLVFWQTLNCFVLHILFVASFRFRRFVCWVVFWFACFPRPTSGIRKSKGVVDGTVEGFAWRFEVPCQQDGWR